MFETFPHTADLGLRVKADSLENLLEEAARGFSSLLIENLDAVNAEETVRFSIPGQDRDFLLVDWLNELLFTFETRRLIFGSFTVTVTDRGLEAEASGESLDPERHHPRHEIKAVTYHGLTVQETPDGWLAEVIFDV